MALESTRSKEIYRANGSTREWPVPFAYSRTEDIQLIHTDSAGREHPVTTNFKVKIGEMDETSVVYPLTGDPVPSGELVTVYRVTPLTQIVDLIYGGAFSPEVLEKDGFDRLEMQVQEIQEEVDRAVKVSISSGLSGDDVMNEIYNARDDAQASARNAGTSAEGAADSAESAAQSETNAETSASDSSTSATDSALSAAAAADSAGLAQKWAENPEDEAVIPDHYSAYHWAKKASENAAGAEFVATLNGLEPDADKNIQLTREITQAEYDALQAAGGLTPGAEYLITDGVNASNLIVIGAAGTAYPVNAMIDMTPHVITVSGPWTPPAPGKYRVRAVGGGGAGGYFLMPKGSFCWGNGGGGSSGEFIDTILTIATLDAVDVTIGAGGTCSVNISGQTGISTAGGATGFGPYFTVAGGNPGTGGTFGVWPGGAAAGPGSQAGQQGWNPAPYTTEARTYTNQGGSPAGGSSPFGVGGMAYRSANGSAATVRNGYNASGYGAGGGGAMGTMNPGVVAPSYMGSTGGLGTQGVIEITRIA